MKFLIFGKEACPHCVRAKEFAADRGLDFEYLTLGVDFTREEIIDKCAPYLPRTMPQIFLRDGGTEALVGTCDDFIAFVNNL